MSKLVKIEILSLFITFSGAAASEFYAKFPGCIAPESFDNLAAFLVVSFILIIDALIIGILIDNN